VDSNPCEEIRDKFYAMTSRHDVAALLGVSDRALRYNLYASGVKESKYIRFNIRKKSGGVRPIIAPDGFLKTIQSRLHRILQCVYEPKESVHGFTLNKCIVTNADLHDQRRWVLNVDIADFFPSINFGRVRGMLMASPYNLPERVATVLANIACVDNQLPQGAPTSPILANMICARMDAHLGQLSRTYRCRYTRYADDLTFSTDQASFPPELVERKLIDGKLVWVPGYKLKRTIQKNGFQINPAKVRLQKFNQRQEVTGLITNRRVNVPRKFVREIRAILNNIRRKGLAECQRVYEAKYAHRWQRHPKATLPPLKFVVKGKIEYVGMVRGKEDHLYFKFLKELDGLIPNFVKVPLRKDELEAVFDHIWMIQTKRSQGTGFMLAGVGLITASHVLGPDGTEIRVTSSHGEVAAKADVLIRDTVRDIAVLDIGVPSDDGLRPSPLTPKALVPVMLLGFPNHNIGDTVHIRSGHISSFRQDPSSPERLILLNAPVIYGNSGGPVLDKSFRVMGVALRGAENEAEAQRTEFHAAMPISVVQSVFGAISARHI
jgi:RNA-directed DNA polymerase